MPASQWNIFCRQQRGSIYSFSGSPGLKNRLSHTKICLDRLSFILWHICICWFYGIATGSFFKGVDGRDNVVVYRWGAAVYQWEQEKGTVLAGNVAGYIGFVYKALVIGEENRPIPEERESNHRTGPCWSFSGRMLDTEMQQVCWIMLGTGVKLRGYSAFLISLHLNTYVI